MKLIVDPSHQGWLTLSLPQYLCGALDKTVFDWGHQMEYFALANVEDELLNFRLGINHLSKDAAKFWRNHKRDTAEADLPTTWAQFGEVLSTNFQPITASKAARDALRTAQARQPSVAWIPPYFLQLGVDIVPNMATEEKLDLFLAGLMPTLRRKIERSNPPDGTFNEAATIAERQKSSRPPSTHLHHIRDHQAQDRLRRCRLLS